MGNFKILGRSLDTFRNDGFYNRMLNTLAHEDGRKSDGILKKSVNVRSHSSFTGAVQLLYYLVLSKICLYIDAFQWRLKLHLIIRL